MNASKFDAGVQLDFKSHKFLFLQGPHGPFFKQFANLLNDAGAGVHRIAFNSGDLVYWDHDLPLTQFQQEQSEWPSFIHEFIKNENITDIVLYGDARFVHAQAIKAARDLNIRTHFFEEGYLRPYWVTYEREGVNGHSPLMELSIQEVSARRLRRHIDQQPVPAQWGSFWHHNWYGFIYHFFLALRSRRFPNYKPHRNIPIWKEVSLNAKRLLMTPWTIIKRDFKTQEFLSHGHPFFVALMQLEHDSSVVLHSDFDSQQQFIDRVINDFASSAPPHVHLVFKLHPLDDGRVPLTKWVENAANAANITARVHVFTGGKLANLLNNARGAIAINSTSVQQVMWRNIPVKILGRSIFDKEGLSTSQSEIEFFAEPDVLDKANFLEYRSYLLETSQIPGGYYTQAGRAEILRRAIDLVMNSKHPYQE